MNQSAHQQFDPKAIEALKAARNQVMQADKSGNPAKGGFVSGREDKNVNPVRDKTPEASAQPLAGISNRVNRGQNLNPREVPNQTSVVASVGTGQAPYQSPEGLRRDVGAYGAGKHDTGQAQFGARNKFAPLEARPAFSGTAVPTSRRDLPLTGFAEEFARKLASVEREKAAVDEEMAKVEKLWSTLAEKKKQLEARRNELTKVKDKLNELDKEMTDFLSKRSEL